jgi:hypothetical protein
MSGALHSFKFVKYAKRYLGGFCFRFNRQFDMAGMAQEILGVDCRCIPASETELRFVEL